MSINFNGITINFPVIKNGSIETYETDSVSDALKNGVDQYVIDSVSLQLHEISVLSDFIENDDEVEDHVYGLANDAEEEMLKACQEIVNDMLYDENGDEIKEGDIVAILNEESEFIGKYDTNEVYKVASEVKDDDKEISLLDVSKIESEYLLIV